MVRSGKYKVSLRDVAHGFITAAITASSVGIMQSLSEGVLPDLAHIKSHAIIGLCGGFGYLLKKFVTNSEGKILKADPKDNLQ